MSRLQKFLSTLIIFGLFTFGLPSGANASTVTPPTLIAINGTTTVTADSKGVLYVSSNGVPPTVAYKGLTKNGVSSLSYQNGYFIATGFFHLAYSSDGVNWKRVYYPIGEKFNAGNIISNEEFFNKDTMSETEVQEFLDSKVSNCTNDNCLKDYTETTFTRAANLMCKEYTAGENETAARIIYKVSQACNVNPAVLLVLLQKEQSLITSKAPTVTQYQKATGYGCPDTAPCNVSYFGFYNQVYLAARQFQRYTNPEGTSKFYTWYPVGTPTQILYHPNVQCGTGAVTIENQATAGLYYYTPYQPNFAALNAIWGEGDNCSAYGNRNFWQYYNAWFNNDKNFKSWLFSIGSMYLAVDDEGSVATSSNLTSWTKQPSLVFSVKNVLRDSDGIVKIVASDDKVYTTVDGSVWTETSLAKPQPVVDESKPVYHKVVKGDTLSKIAKKYKTTVKQILKWNPKITNPNLIKLGQKIIVGYKKA